MDYMTFLNRIIDDGIKAAQHDYAPENYDGDRPTERGLLAGSVAGFEACRGKNPLEIAQLLYEARRRDHQVILEIHRENDERSIDEKLEAVWFAHGFESEVGWVANVLSAAFQNQGLPVIIPPTMRGVMRAAEIVGVKDEGTEAKR